VAAAAAVEAQPEHPPARATVAAAEERQLPLGKVAEVVSQTGISGTVDDRAVTDPVRANVTTANAVVAAAAGNVRNYAKSDGTLSAAIASGRISCSCGS
jgi:cation transport ATPase